MSEAVAIAGGIETRGATSLEIPLSTTFEDWWKTSEYLLMLKNRAKVLELATVWHTMDWLFAGEEMYGQEASQATAFVEDEMGWSPNTYRDYRRIWEMTRQGGVRRHENLGVSHYQAVQGLPPADAKELIELASDLDWTRDELRRRVKQLTEPDAEASVTRKDIERAAADVLKNLQPAQRCESCGKAPAEAFYELQEGPALSLASLLDITIRSLIIEEIQGTL